MTFLFTIKTKTEQGNARRIGHAVRAETITDALATLTKTAQVRPILGVQVWNTSARAWQIIPTAQSLF